MRRVPFAGEGDVETLIGTHLFEWGDEDGPGGDGARSSTRRVSSMGGRGRVPRGHLQPQGAGALAGGLLRDHGRGQRGAGLERRHGGGTRPSRSRTGSAWRAESCTWPTRATTQSASSTRPRGSVRTLAFTNLAAANPRLPEDGVLRVQLPTQVVAPGCEHAADHRLRSPENFKLNAAAPRRGSSFRPRAAIGWCDLSETLLTWSTDEELVHDPRSHRAARGRGGDHGPMGVVYFCRTGKEALCLIQQVRAGGAGAGERDGDGGRGGGRVPAAGREADLRRFLTAPEGGHESWRAPDRPRRSAWFEGTFLSRLTSAAPRRLAQPPPH